jgi:hypothetical protein
MTMTITYEDVVITRRLGHPLSIDTAPQHTKIAVALLFDARAYIRTYGPGHIVIADQVEYEITGYDPADCALTLRLVHDWRPGQKDDPHAEPSLDAPTP